MKLDLREPLPADYVALASWIGSREDCRRWAGPRLPFPFVAANLPALLHSGQAQSWVLAEVAEPPGPALGFGQFWPGPAGAVHLGRIVVSPAQRGRGLGRILVEALRRRALETTAAAAVTLRVYRDNAAAVHLYRTLGFEPVEAESTDTVWFMRAPGRGPGQRPA